MANDHVATPFREILASIIKPVPHPLPVELSVSKQPQTRFHADDINDAFGVLLIYWPANPDARNADERMREAFSRCLVALDRAMSRREEQEIDAFHAYEQAREELDRKNRAAWIKKLEAERMARYGSTEIHDSNLDPGGVK